MRKYLLLFTLITCTVIGVWAQSGRFQPAVVGVHPTTSLNLSNQEVVNQKDVSEYKRCFTVENEAQIRAANPSLPTEAEFETWMARKIEERKAAGITERATYSIPYIVHVIHNGEAIGVGNNISDAKVYAQMSQINDDFQRLNSDAGNTPAAFSSVAGSIDIEFVPAIIDNNGDTMTTPGIRRINRNTEGWSAPPYGGNACGTTGFDNSYIEGTIKPASQWDPTKYMNIWALDMTCGILGYAQFPTGSGLPGLPGSATSNTDGLVLLSSSMGSIANPGSGAPFNLGRTATHEIGHWLGLRHIWGDGTCATDYCDDTPTQSGPNESNCPSFPSVSCSNGPNGDMFMNYMDYTTDACMNIFTQDQVSRFEAVLNNSPRRVELLSSTVGGQVPAEDTCDAGDLTVADSVGLCTGTSVTVSNNGTNTIPSGGGYGFLFTPGADGTGALGGEFLLSGTGTSRTIDESLGGLLPNNSFPNFSGTWYVSGAVYSDGSSGQAAANSVCDLTDSYFVITFIDSADALCDTVVLDPCTAGTLANSDSVGVCEGETFTIETNGDHEFPAAGGYGWNFSPGADGTGGPFAGSGFSYTGAGPTGNTWDNSLNGLLTGLEMEGTWIITGFSYADTNDVSGSLCGFTPTDKPVNFLASNDPACALVEICNNGIDDDGDGQIDCLDGDCATDNNCALASDSCEAPANLSIDNITSSSAEFSWTGSGIFDVELVDITANGTATGTPTATNVSNPYTFGQLASDNDYEAYVRSNCQGNDLILTGVYDGPLTGGTPKGVEIYVLNSIGDLSAYGIGSANNGGGTDGQEFTFSGSATAGTFMYVTTDSARFHEFFGFAADFVDGSMAINGDDAIELFFNGNVLDIFGDINTDGSFTAWDYLDGWAYRKDNTGPEGAIFTISNWDYSGINNLENGTTNATCTSPFPIGTFATAGRVPSEWEGPIPFTTLSAAALPVAAFSASAITVCVGDTIQFTDESTGSPTTWAWDFGDLSGSSGDQNPLYAYTASGTYTVQLIVTNADGSDTATYVDYITVQDPPVGFGATATPSTTIDEGESTTLQMTGTFGGVYAWYDEGGNQISSSPSFSVSPTSTTTYTATCSNGVCTVSASVTITVNPLVTAPSNDECANATPLVCNAPALTGQTTEGAVAEDDPVGCASEYGVWYSFVGDGSEVTITSANNSFDHELDIFSSDSDCNGTFTTVICKDASVGTESHTFTTTNGTQYYVYVAHFSTSSLTTGTFDIEMTCETAVAPPANDSCGGAVVITCPTGFDGVVDPAGATAGDAPAVCAGTVGPGVWYKYVGDGQVLDINVTPYGWDAEVQLLSGSCGSFVCEQNEDDPETITGFTTEVGTDYYIYVSTFASFDTDIDSFYLSVSCSEPASCGVPTALLAENVTSTTADLSWTPGGDETVWHLEITDGPFTGVPTVSGLTDTFYLATALDSLTDYSFYVIADCGTDSSEWAGPEDFTTLGTVVGPSNDDCANATPLVCNAPALTGQTTDGAVAEDDPVGCASEYGVWYSFVGDGSEVTITSENNSFDHELDIFSSDSDCNGTFTTVTCRDGSVGAESYTFTTTIGTQYYVYVAHFSTSSSTTGTFDIEMTCETPVAPPANDSCGGAVVVTCPSGFEGVVDPAGATAGDAPDACAGTVGPGVWYKYVGDGQVLDINVTPYGWDAEIQLLSGSCGSFVCEQNADDPESITGFTTQVGTDYYLYVGTWSSSDTDIDSFYLSISCSEPVICDPFVGDSVENPIVIGSLPYSDIQNQGECFTDQYAQAFESPDVVYEITTGPNTDSLIIDLCNDTTDFDTWMYLSDGIGTLEDNNNSPFGGVCSYLAVDVEPNTTYYIIVEGNFPTDLGWFEITVEEIELPEPPSCATPTALTAENVTSTTADLSWTPGGDETVWHLEITDGPFTGVPTVSGLTDTFYLATGLDSLTEYSFYVIADCGTDSSEWAGPEDFTTLGTTEEPCEVWINPTPTTGWVDFNTIYGGAPCDDGGGCPFNEIDAFEVWASEAYNVENFIAGGEYTFSMCNGPGAGSWVPEFTIIAPSGAIDAFGPGDGDGCSISWTASESGTYLIVINEAGLCGTSTNTATDNGFPALTCNSGGLAACLPPPEAPINDTCSGAIAITCPSGFEGTVDASGATPIDAPLCGGSSTGAGVWYTYEGDGESLNIFVDPYGFDAEIQIHSGSCGALVCETSVDNGLSVGDPESISGFETVIGTTYYIYIGSWISTETVIDSFDLFITCGAVVCDAGSLAPSSIDSFAICPDSTVTIEGLGDETIPVGGGYGIFFVPGPGGTGALGDSFIFNNTPLPLTFDSDLNGVLSGNGFPEFEGTWYVQGATYTDPGNTFNTICDLTDDYMVVTFLAAGEGPCAPPPPAPINDTCSGAIAISCDDIIYGNTDNATADASLGTCGTGLTTAPGVWYVFAGTGEAVEFSLCDDTTDFDTKIGVFEGSCGALNCVAGNDDDCGLASTVEVNTVIGIDYYVYVTGFQTNTGNFGLSVTCSVIVPAPENDTCGGATVITCPSFFVSEDASNATLSDAPTCSGSTVGPGLWYTYTGDGSTLDITATPNDWDMEIQLFSGVCGDLVCEENADVGLDGDPESITDFQTVPGTQYYLYVGTWANFVDDIDAFDLEITCTPPPACDAPTALTVENITETSADLSWTPLSGESSWNIEIVDITDGGTFTGTPTVSGLTDTFYLAIGLNPANEYEFYVQADCDFDESEWAGPEPFETLTPAPSNDTCGGAIALTCGASLEGTTIGASADDKPTSNCFSLSEGVWYTFVGNGDIVTIDVVPDANFDPELDLSSGACGVLTPVACVDDGFSAGDPESVTFFAEVGVDYFLYVSDWNSSTTNDNAGDFTISVSCVTPPANDQCDGAIEVSCDDVITGSTATASPDGSLSFCGTSLTSAPGVWYYFAGTGDDVTASLCGSDFDTKIGVFDGTCDALSCIDGNDDFCGIQSEVTFSTEVGTDYFIYVTGFSSNSGDYTLSITCTVPPCDTAQVSGSITDAVCGGDGAIDITVTGGSGSYTFLWSNGETSEDITGVDAGEYSVEILDAEDGCPATATFTVGGPDALEEPIAAVVVGLPCDGSSTNTASIDVTIEGGTEPYDFLWSNAATTEDLTGLGEGTYTLTVTDANGCTYTTQDFVIEPAGTSSLVEISPAVVTNVDCYGNSTGAIDISVSGGIEPYTYRWSNNLDTEDISGLPAGEYIFFVIDATGCEYTSAVIVVEQPDPIEESTPGVVTNADCNGAATGAIDITVVGGTAPYTYVWSDGSTDEDPSGLAAGSYQATVTDANGCSFLTQVYVVGEPTGIAVGANPVITDADCNGASTGAIDITVSGGTPDYTFLWSDGSSDEDLSGVPAGIYNVIVTDANGCEFVSPAYEVGEPSAIEITAVSVTDVDCNGEATGAINISVSGGTPPYSYLWSNGDVTQDITDLAAGDYVGTITDANGCTIVSPAVTVGEPAAIEVTEAIVTDVDCNGASTGSIDITVDGGTPPYTYVWSNGATTEDLVGVPAGDYFGIITDANGCIFASPILTVNEPDALAISSVDVTDNLCNGDEEGAVDIEVTGGTEPYSYLWSNGETSQDISGLAAGSYTGVITDANGCELTATVTVGEPAAIFEALPPAVTQISCNGETDGAIDITIQGGVLPYTYLWSNGETTADISGLEAGEYSYVVTDANGCVFDPGTTITIEEPEVLTESASVTDVACLGESTGSIDLTVEGGTAPYTYAWSNGAASEDISELAAGDYSVTITDANGCSLGSATYTVGEPATALTAEVTVTDESGNGVGDGTATVTASGGDGPYSYNWAGGFGISPTIDNLTSGIYCANVTDGNGCTITVCGTVGSPTAIDDIFQVSLITLYPNPTYDIANLQVSFTKAIDVELALVDVLGKVYESEYVLSTDEVAKSFDMRKYAAGTYFIRITADKEVITLPLVVQH